MERKVGCEVLARRSLSYGTCWHESEWPERERPHGYWVCNPEVSACVGDVHNARRSRSGLTSGEVAQNPWWKVQ